MWYSAAREVPLSINGQEFSFVQDNASLEVGTTVWEASLVAATWLDSNKSARWGLGRGTRGGVCGKRALELGAGCGVAGFCLALMGADVTVTDIPAVLPILKRNIKRNVNALDPERRAVAGKLRAAQLCWGRTAQAAALKPPFDLLLATDVVYLEEAVQPLISTMLSMADAHTRILFGYKMRQEEAHALFWAELPKSFEIQKIPDEELDPNEAFKGVHLYILKVKPPPDAAQAVSGPQ